MWGKEVVYSVLIKYQFFSGPFPLGCNLYKHCSKSIAFSPGGETGKIKLAELREMSLLQMESRSGKVFSWRVSFSYEEHSGRISYYLFLLLPGVRRVSFLIFHYKMLVHFLWVKFSKYEVP